MDLETIRQKLDDTEYEQLSNHVAALTEKAEKAVNESIHGRKSMKAEVERLRTLNAQIMDRLGIADADELDNMPDIRGQAEAARQYEARVKRLERDLTERTEALNKLHAQQREDRQAALLAKAMQSHEWTAPDVVETYLRQSITWEDDTPFFKAEDGKLVGIEEGVTLVAQTKPALLKSHGAGGSGYTPGSGSSRGAEANLTLDTDAIYRARLPA